MAELRNRLAGAGLAGARTHLQTCNVVVESDEPRDAVVQRCERTIAGAFGLDVRAVVRTREDLARVVERDPLGHVATTPKRYLVTFLAAPPPPGLLPRLQALAEPPEQLVADGCELYAWHPETVAGSRLWAALAGRGLGVTATARNWTTVTALLALAGG